MRDGHSLLSFSFSNVFQYISLEDGGKLTVSFSEFLLAQMSAKTIKGACKGEMEQYLVGAPNHKNENRAVGLPTSQFSPNLP